MHQLGIRIRELLREIERPTDEWLPTPELKIDVAGSYRKEFVEKMTEILDSPKVTVNGSHNFRLKLKIVFQAFNIFKKKDDKKETINFVTFHDYFFQEKEKEKEE